MDKNIIINNEGVNVRLVGELYVQDATDLRSELIEYIDKGHKVMVFQLDKLDYIDSSGLGVLVTIHKRTIQNGGRMLIKGLQGRVKKLFELTRLDQVFTLI